jgi:hypothetical protein
MIAGPPGARQPERWHVRRPQPLRVDQEVKAPLEELERHLREPATAERRAEQAPHPALSPEGRG